MKRLAFHILCAALLSGPALAEVKSARFADPTTRYGHGILGDSIEYGALILRLKNGQRVEIRLPETRVFEDLNPRLADLDGDGSPEVIVVETSLTLGAQLAVYNETGKIAATPFLGRPHRWLAPSGVADLDGDGRIEIAYVEKPHLSKILKIWHLEAGELRFVTSLAGLTNHKIGQDFISGGIRDCGDGPQIITASGNWSDVMATTFDGATLTSAAIGAFTSQSSFKKALACND